jgi:carboxypeptidase C (cathepsin A)
MTKARRRRISLPSEAAANLEARGQIPTAASMRPIEAYARSEFVADMLAAAADPAAARRLTTKVAAHTGLDPTIVARRQGHVSGIFLREFHRADGKVGSGYDSNVTTYDPFRRMRSAPMTIRSWQPVHHARRPWSI